jgi:hypothetical protein
LQLAPLYRIRFTYPESWTVGLEGGWEQHFFLAEGRCDGSISGRFRGANYPRREGAEGPFRPDFRAVNDAVCVCVGEVRAPADPAQPEPDLVLDVAELIWEPIAD